MLYADNFFTFLINLDINQDGMTRITDLKRKLRSTT